MEHIEKCLDLLEEIIYSDNINYSDQQMFALWAAKEELKRIESILKEESKC